MKKYGYMIFLVFILVMCIAIRPRLAEGKNDEPLSVPGITSVEKKTVERGPDPVIIEGKCIKGFLGSEINCLRVYAFQNGALYPIPFQIDERFYRKARDPDKTDFVFTDGPEKNPEKGDGKLSEIDQLAVMCMDLGDKVEVGKLVRAGFTASEIEVKDPLNGAMGWCYLIGFPADVPVRATKDYVRYDWDKDAIYTTDFYVGYDPVVKRTTYKSFGMVRPDGTSGPNYCDRLKARSHLKLLWSLVKLSGTEDDIHSEVVCYIDGPVRVLRRVVNFSPMPLGIRAFKTYVDNFYYKNVVSVPIAFDIPIDYGPLFSESLIRIGTDYSPDAIGGMNYNSNNLEGFMVDGMMSPQEQKMNHAQDSWRVISGGGLGLLTRNIQSPALMKFINVSVSFIDDISHPDPPEKYPGNIGAYFQNYEGAKVIKGKYDLWLQYYSVPDYEPGEEVEYLNILDHPLEYSVDGVGGVSDIAGKPPRL